MGDGAAGLGALDCSDATSLIGVRARAEPRIDVRHSNRGRSAWRRIKIGVEDAAGGAELELEPLPFADLERRGAQALHELGGRHADKIAANVQPRRRDDCRLGCRSLGNRCTAGDEKAGDDHDAAHLPMMAGRIRRGKLAANSRHR